VNEALDPDLLSVLACPCPHHAPLQPVAGDARPALECQRCQSRFPVRDGVPVLLLDEAVPGPRGVGGEP
jgi:uncharacterized protein YbaR (Trm112 family)